MVVDSIFIFSCGATSNLIAIRVVTRDLIAVVIEEDLIAIVIEENLIAVIIELLLECLLLLEGLLGFEGSAKLLSPVLDLSSFDGTSAHQFCVSFEETRNVNTFLLIKKTI